MSVIFNGNVAASLRGVNAIAGSEQGSTAFGFQYNKNVLVGAADPNFEGGGGYQGSFTAVVGGTLINLADQTNIVKSGGAVVGGGVISPGQGYVITALKRLRALYLANEELVGSTKVITVTIPGSNGLAGLGWVAGAVALVLQPGAGVLLPFPTGSAVLTAGSNDGLIFTSSSGSPAVDIGVIAG